MDSSLLFEQLEWAFNQDFVGENGFSNKIHTILREALENAQELGFEQGIKGRDIT